MNNLHKLIKKNDLNGIKLLLEKGSTDLNALDKNGVTALHSASYEGVNDIVACLCDYGADVNYGTDHGYTPLMAASRVGHLDVVNTLLQKGADINYSDQDGFTALIIAASYCMDNRITIQLLKSGADIDHTTKTGNTALISAVWFGMIDNVAALVASGANQHIYSNGKKAIEVAVSKGFNQIVSLLKN